MAIFRVERNKGYTVMSNHHLRNTELTLKSKGLLSQMLSLPEGWDYTLRGLSKINRESIDAIRTAVLELEKAGYIARQQGRDAMGKMTAIEYIIYEQPPENSPCLENPISGEPRLENPITDNPLSENPMQLNKEILNTNLLKKDLLNTDLKNINSFQFAFKESTAKKFERKGSETEKYKNCEKAIKKNIDYENMVKRHGHEALDEIVMLILEIMCTEKDVLLIAGDTHPATAVQSRFLQLTAQHIDFVFECMKNNTTKVRNIKKYLLATLFNAPSTIDNYYCSLVNHDLHEK